MTDNPWADLRSENELLDGPYDPRARPWAIGVASARPAATQVPPNSFFYATDTKEASFSNGATWTAIGARAASATTVAGLGTGSDGALGVLRVGSSPYDFLNLTYDSTYGKWVSDPWIVGAGGRNTYYNTANTWKSVNNVYQPAGSAGDDGTATDTFFPYKAFVDAGLTLQWRLVCVLVSDGTTVVDGGLQITCGAANSALGTSSTDAVLITHSANTGVVKDSGWATAASVTSDTWGYITIRFRSNALDSGAMGGGTAWCRWVS